MNQSLIFVFSVFTFFAQPWQTTKQYEPTQSQIVAVDSNSSLKNYFAKISYANMLLQSEEFAYSYEKKNGKQSIVERPIILACLDEFTCLWHVVHISLPYPTPKEYFRNLRRAKTIAGRDSVHVPIRVLTEGYIVEHERGVGSRLVVRVYKECGGLKIPLTVYRIKFPNFKGTPPLDLVTERQNVQAICFTPISKTFINKDLEDEGKRFLRKHIQLAFDDLRDLGVYSASYRGRLLANVFPVEVLMSLMISEQWDPLYFMEARDSSMSSILCEYATNREYAFAWSVSSANAIGCLQFTNRGSNGTYANVVRKYPDAMLSKDFSAGVRDMHNVIKAAVCLLDLELAESEESLKLFQRDSMLGSVLPISAYNGGPFAGAEMLRVIKKLNGQSFDTTDVLGLKIPYSIRCSFNEEDKRWNAETPMYVLKYFYLMKQFQIKQLE